MNIKLYSMRVVFHFDSDVQKGRITLFNLGSIFV